MSPSRPFSAKAHLKSRADIAVYIEAMLEDGDARAVPIVLRTIADCVGGMRALAQKTKLPSKTLHRALSGKGSPRINTLAMILAAFGLRFTVQPIDKSW